MFLSNFIKKAAMVLVTASMAISAGSAAYSQTNDKPITVFYQEWVTSTTISNIAKLMLEKIGYKVEMKLLDTGLIYQALGAGQGELFASSYLPGQQTYLDRVQDKVDIIGTSYGPLPGGIGVPAYMNIKSIEDLQDPKVMEQLGGKIIGIDAGAGVMRLAKRAVDEYGLGIKLIPSSEAAKTAALQGAYEKKAPIAVIHTCPHILCSKYDVKFLDLSKQVKKTTVVITHDLDEAMKLGDRVAIMRDGRIVQVGTPEDIVLNPVDEYVRRFLRDVPRSKILSAQSIMSPGARPDTPGPRVNRSAKLESVVTLASPDTDIVVADDEDCPIGTISNLNLLRALA